MRTLSFRQSAVICAVAIFIGLVLVVAGAGRAFADESLDQLLASSMENHPDIVAAKAKVTLAEAELNAMRLQVARQLIALWGNRDSQHLAVEMATEQNKRIAALPPNAMDNETKSRVAQSLKDASIKLEQAEAEIKFLTSKAIPAAAENEESKEPPKESQQPQGAIVDELGKEFRTKTIKMEFVDAPLSQVIDYMKNDLKYPIYLDNKALNEIGTISDTPITMDMPKTPLPAVLQAMQDQNQGWMFVIRDYGILLTTIDQAKAQGYYSALDYFGR
jgi:hypothetical protein